MRRSFIILEILMLRQSFFPCSLAFFQASPFKPVAFWHHHHHHDQDPHPITTSTTNTALTMGLFSSPRDDDDKKIATTATVTIAAGTIGLLVDCTVE
jgi:hypothetical protein